MKLLSLHPIAWLTLIMVVLIQCKKAAPETRFDAGAKVVHVKWACGAGCDAASFLILTSNNELYTPVKLANEFKVHNLPVKIHYSLNGTTHPLFTGPQYELITIRQISR